MNMTPEAKMIQFVKTCDDPKRLRTIAENADRNAAGDLARAARLRLYSVLPSEEPGTLGHEVWQSIYALEDTLKQERGKTVLLSRTRQKIQRVGEQGCVADLVTGSESEGFRMLLDRAMLDLTFEAVALRFPDRFSDQVLKSARARLAKVGYAV